MCVCGNCQQNSPSASHAFGVASKKGRHCNNLMGAECVLFLGVERALFTLLWIHIEFLALHRAPDFAVGILRCCMCGENRSVAHVAPC